MSPIGRIFIVLNLLLSGLFVGWAASNLANAEDYQKQLADKETELATVTAEKDDQIAGLVSEKSNFEERAGEMREERDRLKEENERLKNQLSKLQLDYDGLKAQVDGIQASLEQYATANERQTEAVKEANDLARAAESARESAEEERDDALEAASTASEALALLEKDLADSQKRIASLEKERDNLDTKLAMLAEYTNVSLSELITQPDIDAFVVNVHQGEGYTLVSLDKGSNHGVKRGFTFSVFNNGVYKGEVRVESVQPTGCTAVVTRSVDGQTISNADNASTQI